jgi:hypothetical protein
MKASLKIGLYIIIAYGATKWWINRGIPWDSVWLYEYEQIAGDNHTLMARYVVARADTAVLDSLRKYGQEKILDTLAFHVELSHKYSPEWLFFTRRSLVEPVLVYRSPFLGDCQLQRKYGEALGRTTPSIFFKMSQEDTLVYTGYRSREAAVFIFLKRDAFTNYDLDDELELYCFWGIKGDGARVNETRLGKVWLRRTMSTSARPRSELKFYPFIPEIPQPWLDCPK